jgi:predicted dehydrogenase
MKRIALIGVGKMGISHLAVLGAHPKVEVAAICDDNRTVVGMLSEVTNIKAYHDYETMFANERLDGVVIATPSRFHGAIVRAALDRSVSVFCEKPFCLDAAEGAELTELAERKNLVNQVGYHYRYVGAFREANRLIKGGALGRIHNIRAEAYGPVVLRPKGGTWRSSRSEGGGCLYDYASHAIDLMNFLVGAPSEVRGTVINKVFSRDVDDEVYSNFFYRDGMTGQVLANWSDESHRKMSMKVNVFGEKGKIQADRQEIQIYLRDNSVAKAFGLKNGWNIRYTTDLSESPWYYLRGEEYSAQIAAFVDALHGDQTGAVSSFRLALDTDRTIALMINDADEVRTQLAGGKLAKRGIMRSVLGLKR